VTLWGGGGTYNQWVAFLDRWGAGEQVDPAGLPPLVKLDFTGDGWARIVNRLTDALSARLQGWADALTRAIGAATDEFGVARALAQARGGLRTVRALTAHPGLPPEVAKGLLDMVDGQVRALQQSLEEQVETLRRSGANPSLVEARRRTFRENALTVVTAEPTGAGSPAASPPPAAPAGDPTAPGRRRVIVD